MEKAQMQFDWMVPKVNKAFLKKIEGRPGELGRQEIEQRAALLMRLNYTKAAAVKRICDNIAWEYELASKPAFFKDVKDIVDCVYRGANRCA
jgi:hypothetical protein